jgi:hypothetical protein
MKGFAQNLNFSLWSIFKQPLSEPIQPLEGEGRAAGDELGLNEDEVAFYDPRETNDSAVRVLGNNALCTIAPELVATVRANVTIDWTVRENVRAQLPVLVKRSCENIDTRRIFRRRRRDGQKCSPVVGQRNSTRLTDRLPHAASTR